jgi:hypothetical protein
MWNQKMHKLAIMNEQAYVEGGSKKEVRPENARRTEKLHCTDHDILED